MKLTLQRLHGGDNSTIGALYVDGKFRCFTCEDEYRIIKVAGHTRIPAGTFPIKLRKAGGMFKTYAQRYPWHDGMLWIDLIPGFDWVYLHIGNTHKDTEGCILVGDTARNGYAQGGWVEQSGIAYRRLYEEVTAVLNAGQHVSIEVLDEPRY